MADNRIDKALPNTNLDDKLPSPDVLEEVDVTEVEEKTGPVEVTPEDDGGATIDFDPSKVNIPLEGGDHFGNLADILPKEILDPIGLQLSGYLQKRLRNFKRKLIKNYYQLMDR
jgi:hypothetical protein